VISNTVVVFPAVIVMHCRKLWWCEFKAFYYSTYLCNSRIIIGLIALTVDSFTDDVLQFFA